MMARMSMIRAAAVLVLAGWIASCATPEQRLAADRDRCAKFGFSEGTDAFSSCLMHLSLDRSPPYRHHAHF